MPQLAAGLAWLFLLFHDVIPAINHVTQGFAAYYGAAYAVLHGGAADLNNNLAFQGWLTQAGIGVREVYQGNSPTLALLMTPLTPFSPALAQTIWLVLNVAMLITCMVLVIRLCGANNSSTSTRWWIATVVPLLVGIRANIQFGQVYILLALLALCALAAMRDLPHPLNPPLRIQRGGSERLQTYDLAASAAIGAMIVIKPFYGVIAILLLLLSRRWRTALIAVIVVVIVVVASLPLLADAWPGFLNAQVIIGQIPWAGIPANQTLNSMFQHLFVFTPDWNTAPLLDAPWLAAVLYYGLSGALITVTLWRARKHDPLWLWLPALALMPILAPVGEVHHEALLLFSAAMAITRLRSVKTDEPLSPTLSPHAGKGSQTRITSPSLRAGRDLGRGKLNIQLAVVIFVALALLIIPWPNLNDPALWGGWHGLLAYPRLYGALLLWAALV